MSRIVRLRVKLVDETGTYEEGRTRKIIYGLNVYKHILIRDVRQDLSLKLGINSDEHDLEIWVDEYLVPGYTSSLVFKDDEEILVKVVAKGANSQEEHDQAFVDEMFIGPVKPDDSNGAEHGPGESTAIDSLNNATWSSDSSNYFSAGYAGLGKSSIASGGYRKPTALGAGAQGLSKGMMSASHFQKPAMQCFHWDSSTHIKTSCKFWHPRELCKNYPMCTHGASTCGFAHPFCAEFCECHPHAKDPQKNHRMKQQKPPTPVPVSVVGLGIAPPPPPPMATGMEMFGMS